MQISDLCIENTGQQVDTMQAKKIYMAIKNEWHMEFIHENRIIKLFIPSRFHALSSTLPKRSSL